MFKGENGASRLYGLRSVKASNGFLCFITKSSKIYCSSRTAHNKFKDIAMYDSNLISVCEKVYDIFYVL